MILSTGVISHWVMALPSADRLSSNRLSSIGTCLAIQGTILLLGSWLVSLHPELRQPLDSHLRPPSTLKS